MKGEKNKRHHFIPQCYLRFFSENGKYINVYSKKNKRKNPIQGISSTGCEAYFYKIPEKYIRNLDKNVFHSNFFEQDFFANNVEALLKPILKTIHSAAENWKTNHNNEEILKKSDKDIFAALIAIQYLRMPNIREKYWSLHKKISQERIDILSSFFRNELAKNNGSVENIQLDIDEEYQSVHHASIFSDEELINKLQDHLLNKIWVFNINEQDDFYTSDNPILLKPHLQNQTAFYEGFAMKGVEIIFPLGSSILLTLWDKMHFQEKLIHDNKFLGIDDKLKREYNCYQYIWANDLVYSKTNNFGLIEGLKLLNGGEEIIQRKSITRVNGK